MSDIQILEGVEVSLEGDETDFLRRLAKPSWLVFDGVDSSRTRVLTTLLHGNEPSGLKAFFRLMKQGLQPATNMCVFVGSVKAALTPPLYSNRYLPDMEDLNRSFAPPFDTPTRFIAQALMGLIQDCNPEAIIDLHNTSGSSMGFAICVKDCEQNEALASLFTQKLIVADLKLGSLMEYGSSLGPCVTIECGGIEDKTSDIIAFEGIKHYWLNDNILTPLSKPQKIFNPMRLELKENFSIGFSTSKDPEWDITLPPEVVQYNYKILQPGAPFGWVGVNGLDVLQVTDGTQANRVHEFFEVRDYQLLAKQPLRLFMVTANPKIAKADCLFYLVVQPQ